MRTRLSTASLVVVALATLTAQGSQTPRSLQPPEPQQPVFRVESNFIRVDMYATEDGQFVTDLRPGEVEVYEDGVRQQVETFEYVRIAAGESATSERYDDEETMDAARSRVYVVFIDTYTTRLEREGPLRLSLVRFLDRLLGPNDLVGLMTPEMSASEVTLGRRSTVISDLANDERWVRRTPPAREDLKEFAWENCYPSRGAGGRAAEMKARRGAKVAIDALQNLVAHLRDLREERKAVLVITAGWTFPTNSSLNAGGGNETESCRSDRLALAGEDYDGSLRDLTRSANRANVSFYPVNTRRVAAAAEFSPMFRGGVGITPAMLRQRERQLFEISHQQLRSLAEDTDGMAEASASNLDRVTRRIIDDTSAYYLLGYQSTNSRVDGRFRSISVKVLRPGVKVRARTGYGGDVPAVLTASGPVGPIVDSRVSLAIGSVERFDTLAPVWLRSSPWTPPQAEDGGAFWFVGEVGTLIRGQRPWAGGAIADVVVVGADKSAVFSRTVQLKSSDAAFSLRVPDSGQLPPGDYTVRVKLQPADAEDTAVHDATRVTLEEGAAGPGPAVLWRRGGSSRLDYVRTADPRFRRTERLRLEFPTVSNSAASARLLDRLGNPLQVPTLMGTRSDASGAFRWIVIDAPLAGLAPGDYAIELSQDDVTQVTGFRMVP